MWENAFVTTSSLAWSAAYPLNNIWFMKKLDNSCMATAMRVTVVTRHHSFDYTCIVTQMCLCPKSFPLQLFCASCASSVLVQVAMLLLVQAVCSCATRVFLCKQCDVVQEAVSLTA